MRIHYLQHVPFEGPAAIADWAQARGHDLQGTRLDRGEPLPGLDDFDWLVVMGGPMGVGEQADYPWMAPEIGLIREAVQAKRRVLGVCLGAQFLASALGARVYPATYKEIGWFPVQSTSTQSAGSFEGFPPELTPLNWHGDTFDLPIGAIPLAHGPDTINQAFQVGRRALGLQFHLEATPDSVASLVDHCAGEIGGGPWEMAAPEIRDCHERCARVRPILESVLDYLEAPEADTA
jgi:GMP synthase-like glutamine amidotransferase